MTNNFKESGLHQDILKSINELGFVVPTPIQASAIPFIIEKSEDLVALAHTGTGKTAAFGLPLLQMVDRNINHTQVLILSPTRELCMQICDDLQKYSKYLDDIKIVAVYGGANIDRQIKILKKGVHIVVGTPGRTLDLIKRKALQVENVQWSVLDEADEMLNMGFQEDLDLILENTPDEKRTFLFSATMPDGVMRIAKKYMNQWEKIAVNTQNTASGNVKHIYYVAHARNRFEALKRIVDAQPNIYGIVFCRTRQETKDLADSMIQNGYDADALHGDVPQAQRTIVMNRFKTRQLQILIATDVAARGVDVTDLTHVINYNLPDDKEVYVHRSGRTGRAGKYGVSVAIVHTRELHKIRDIEKFSKISFEKKQIPSGAEVCEKQLFNLVDRIENVIVVNDQIERFLPTIYKKLSWLSREELIQKMVSVEFNRFLEYYRNAPDLNAENNSSKEKGTRNERGKKKQTKYASLSLSVGTKHGMDARHLIGLINELTNSDTIPIGKIELTKKQSFFEVGVEQKQLVMKVFQELSLEYPDVIIKEVSGRSSGSSQGRSSGKKRAYTPRSKSKPTSKQRRQRRRN